MLDEAIWNRLLHAQLLLDERRPPNHERHNYRLLHIGVQGNLLVFWERHQTTFEVARLLHDTHGFTLGTLHTSVRTCTLYIEIILYVDLFPIGVAGGDIAAKEVPLAHTLWSQLLWSELEVSRHVIVICLESGGAGSMVCYLKFECHWEPTAWLANKRKRLLRQPWSQNLRLLFLRLIRQNYLRLIWVYLKQRSGWSVEHLQIHFALQIIQAIEHILYSRLVLLVDYFEVFLLVEVVANAYEYN